METSGVQEGPEASSELNCALSLQDLARSPKHLWQQLRRPIRIEQPFHSDPDKSACRSDWDRDQRPRLEKLQRSWPTSFHRQ